MSQPRPTQQQGSSDMQLWQQHLMYKRLEIQRQRQQQLQQLNLGGSHQNTQNHVSDVARHAGIAHSPPVLSGMPISCAPDRSWSSEPMDGESKAMNNSPMFLAGNMNWAQPAGSLVRGRGFVFSHGQGQMRPIGFVQQHGDQSLYGTPVSRFSSNQYPQHGCADVTGRVGGNSSENVSTQPSALNQHGDQSLYGTPVSRFSSNQYPQHGCTDVTGRVGGNSSENVSTQPSALNYFPNDQGVFTKHGCLQDDISVANQNIQGDRSFGYAPIQDLNSGAMLGNFQQINHFTQSVQAQELQGGQEQDDWSGNLQENLVLQVGPSHSMASLDPTENKLSYTGNDGQYDGSFGDSTITNTRSNHHVSLVQNNHHTNVLPSSQSGSWSALMQDAVEASSSDTGLREEWSGLNFMNAEPSTQNHYALLNQNEKQHLHWNEKNMQSASSLTSSSHPLFNNADMSPNRHSFTSFQQSSTKSVHGENESLSAEVSHESSQHSSKAAKNKQFNQSHQIKQFVQSSLHEQSFDNVSNGFWAGQPVTTQHSVDMEFNTQNMPMVRDNQQRMLLRNVSSMSSDKSIGWSVNQSPIEDSTSRVPDNGDTEGHAWKDDGNRVVMPFPNQAGEQEPVKSETGSTKMWDRDFNIENFTAATDSNVLKFNQEVKQQLFRQHLMDYAKHVSVHSSLNFQGGVENVGRYQNQLSRGEQIRYSSLNSTEKKESVEGLCQKPESNNPGDIPDEGYMSSHSHLSQHADSGSDPRQNSLSTGNDSGLLVTSSQTLSGQSGQKYIEPHKYPHGPNNSVARGLNNQEQGDVGHSDIARLVTPPSYANVEKGQLTEIQRHPQVKDELHSICAVPSNVPALSSYDVLGTHASQSNRIGQASHNMLEFLHKVDQSKNKNTIRFGFSDYSALNKVHKNAASDGSALLQQGHSSSLQGFGTKLTQTSQWQPVLDRAVLLQETNDFSSRNLDSCRGDQDRAWSSTTTSVPCLPLANQVPHDKFNNTSKVYRKENKRTSYSGIEANPRVVTTSSLPYARDDSAMQQQQEQRKHISSVTGSSVMDQSAIPSVGGQVDTDAHVRHFSHPRHAQGSNHGNISAQELLRSVASRFPSSRLNPSRDTCNPASSQFHTFDSGPSPPVYPNSLPETSCQQLPLVEARSAAQPSATSGMSQQGGFSSMLHRVCSSLSTQQHLSLVQAKTIISQLPQSMSSLPNSMDAKSWAQNDNNQCTNIGGSVQSEFGTCSTNSQEFIYAADFPVKGQSSQHIPPERVGGTTKSCAASPGQQPAPVSSLAHLHQQKRNGRKHARDSSVDFHKDHVVLHADKRKQNSSQLKQSQAMNRSDSHPSRRAVKRLKGEDFGDDGQPMELAAGQRFLYDQNPNFRELDAGSQHRLSPSDVKRLGFSRENADECAGEKPSKDLLASRQDIIENHTHYLNKTSTLACINVCLQSNSQMAPSSEQSMAYRNVQVGATYDEPGNSQSSAKATSHHYTNENSFTHGPPAIVCDSNVVLIPKKRKNVTSGLLPWHKKLTLGSQRPLNIRSAQLDWAKAANRLIEKVEDGSEMIVCKSSTARPQRRLILTTQLMQQLLPSAPATFLRSDAITSYESVTCFVAKLSLGDACSLIFCSGSDSLVHSNSENRIPEKLESSKEVRDHSLSKEVGEHLIGRTRKLESGLLRLETNASISDIRKECDDLDRCSIDNRLSKFHGQAETDTRGSSSTAETLSPQRHVTAHAVPVNPPEDVLYLSL